MKFMKLFVIQHEAELFALTHGGEISIRYDWDELRNQMIKFYVVKF